MTDNPFRNVKTEKSSSQLSTYFRKTRGVQEPEDFQLERLKPRDRMSNTDFNWLKESVLGLRLLAEEEISAVM
jgi:dephospho-CoA kinase